MIERKQRHLRLGAVLSIPHNLAQLAMAELDEDRLDSMGFHGDSDRFEARLSSHFQIFGLIVDSQKDFS